MAGTSQPTEPVFATTIDFGGSNIYGIMKLVTEHQRDYLDIRNAAANNVVVYTTRYVAPGTTKYVYDSGEGKFTVDANGTYYATTVTNNNYYPTAIDDIRDVYARLRPVEIRFPDRKFYDASKVHLRVGIAKQILQFKSTETTATLRTFDGAFNLSNQTNAVTDVTDEQELETYVLPEDVNDGTITYARVNGLRSYLLTQLPLATDTSTGCSFEIGMTNEGRLFDYTISAIPSNQE